MIVYALSNERCMKSSGVKLTLQRRVLHICNVHCLCKI